MLYWSKNFRVEFYYWYAVDSHGHARRRGRKRTAGGLERKGEKRCGETEVGVAGVRGRKREEGGL